MADVGWGDSILGEVESSLEIIGASSFQDWNIRLEYLKHTLWRITYKEYASIKRLKLYVVVKVQW